MPSGSVGGVTAIGPLEGNPKILPSRYHSAQLVGSARPQPRGLLRFACVWPSSQPVFFVLLKFLSHVTSSGFPAVVPSFWGDEQTDGVLAVPECLWMDFVCPSSKKKKKSWPSASEPGKSNTAAAVKEIGPEAELVGPEFYQAGTMVDFYICPCFLDGDGGLPATGG